jgi:hypothetical protein
MPPKAKQAPASAAGAAAAPPPPATLPKFVWIEAKVASNVREDFLALTLKAVQLHGGRLPLVAASIRTDLCAVHGQGWNVCIGRDVWRVLRSNTLTSAGLKCTAGSPEWQGLVVLAYKAADDVAAAPVLAAPPTLPAVPPQRPGQASKR